jgi:hypothetical protein
MAVKFYTYNIIIIAILKNLEVDKISSKEKDTKGKYATFGDY